MLKDHFQNNNNFIITKTCPLKFLFKVKSKIK